MGSSCIDAEVALGVSFEDDVRLCGVVDVVAVGTDVVVEEDEGVHFVGAF